MKIPALQYSGKNGKKYILAEVDFSNHQCTWAVDKYNNLMSNFMARYPTYRHSYKSTYRWLQDISQHLIVERQYQRERLRIVDLDL